MTTSTLKITGEYGDKYRTVTVTNVSRIKGQTAYKGIWPSGKWVRITSNTVLRYSGTKVRTVLKDFTSFEFV